MCFRHILKIFRAARWKQLQRLGVEVLTSTMVTQIEPGVISMAKGE